MKKSLIRNLAIASAALLAEGALASSHMDAPLITLDPAANTTDVYAFVANPGGEKNLVLALGVYPHQEPGVGPNKYNFDDNVLYSINVSLGADVAAGRATLAYQFRFNTTFQNSNTILQSYLGVINTVGDASQNLIQTYTVTRRDFRTGASTLLGSGTVPPNNQGNATPLYNVGDDGNNPAKPGVATVAELDQYTTQSIATLSGGISAFAGQRDDGFYGDINSIFDLLSLRSDGDTTDGVDTGVDSQGGFNINLMALSIPVTEFGGDQQIVSVYANVFRPSVRIVTNTTFDRDRDVRVRDPRNSNRPTVRRIKVVNTITTTQTQVPVLVPVARQGNPLFNEALVAIADKDLYSRTDPSRDNELFRKYAITPELAALANAILGTNAETDNRTDIAGIFIPDVIKVDLSTPPARLAGNGSTTGVNPDDAGFSRLGIFGGDVLTSTQQSFLGPNQAPGGWPNGRRFGDDVVDIAISALLSDLRSDPPSIAVADGIDGVSMNDATYSKVFPYESTPLNGRNHTHP